MAAPHAFLDILANRQVRDAYLAGRITLICSTDLETILWANGAGARFLGFDTVADSINVTSGFDRHVRSQIEAGLVHGAPVYISGRPWAGEFLVNTISIGQVGQVVFLRSVGAAVGKEGVDLTEGLSDETTEAAVLDLSGQVMRASAGFDLDWFDSGELVALLREANADGSVKKRFLARNNTMPVGLLQLSATPAIFLLIAVRPETAALPASAGKRGLSLQEREAFSAIARHLQAEIVAPADKSADKLSSRSDGWPRASVEAALPPLLLEDHEIALPLPDAANQPDGRGAPAPGMPSFLEQLPLAVLIYRADKALFANQAFLALSGYETLAAFCQAGAAAALVDGWSVRHEMIMQNGTSVPVRLQKQAVIWPDGHAAIMVSFTPAAAQAGAPRPVLTRGDTGETPASKDKTFELLALLNVISDGVIVLDRTGLVMLANEPAYRLFGYGAEQMNGQAFSRFFAEKSLEAVGQLFSAAKEQPRPLVTGEGREVDGVDATGKPLKLHVRMGKMRAGESCFLIVRDLTRFHTVISGLLRNQYQAADVSKRKSRYLALVSHEIRTPLNAIIGLSQIMLAEKHGPLVNERYRDYLNDIIRSGAHIMTFINDLLQASKNEEGLKKLDIKPVALAVVLNDVLGLMMPQANAHHIIIRAGLAADLPAIAADVRSLRQIFLNLLSNAIRFTPQGGQIIISAYHQQPDKVLLRIRDTGIGMTPDEIREAMQPYRQVEGAAAKAQQQGGTDGASGGTGLGLPLTRALAEANHARFVLHSEPGKGTVVELVFRIAESAAAAAG